MAAIERTASLLRTQLGRTLARAKIALKKMRLKRSKDFDLLFSTACSDFGILQKKWEIESVLEFATVSKPATVGEIGSYKCGTSFLLTQIFAEANKFIFVDRELHNQGLLEYYRSGSGAIFFVEGDSCSTDVRSKVRMSLGEALFDFIFIDGDHSFSGVKNDLLTYFDLVRDGGYICFHDIVPDYRTKYNIQSGTYSGEVYKLWEKLKNVFPCSEFVEKEGQDGFGIGLMVKDDKVSLASLAEIIEA